MDTLVGMILVVAILHCLLAPILDKLAEALDGLSLTRRSRTCPKALRIDSRKAQRP